MSKDELAALSVSRAFGMGNTIFKYLKIGDRFTFDKVYVKTSRNGYVCEGTLRPVFRTGMRTAVHKIEE